MIFEDRFQPVIKHRHTHSLSGKGQRVCECSFPETSRRAWRQADEDAGVMLARPMQFHADPLEELRGGSLTGQQNPAHHKCLALHACEYRGIRSWRMGILSRSAHGQKTHNEQATSTNV